MTIYKFIFYLVLFELNERADLKNSGTMSNTDIK